MYTGRGMLRVHSADSDASRASHAILPLQTCMSPGRQMHFFHSIMFSLCRLACIQVVKCNSRTLQLFQSDQSHASRASNAISPLCNCACIQGVKCSSSIDHAHAPRASNSVHPLCNSSTRITNMHTWRLARFFHCAILPLCRLA